MEWYLKVIKENYANFNGRARRKEYWMFALFNTIFAIIAMVLDNIFGITMSDSLDGPFSIIYGLAVLIPGLAVLVRRLHDVGKSGWFFFIILIPIVGIIWLLVLLLTDGNFGPNEYGEDPKATERDTIFPPLNNQQNEI